MLVFPFHCCHWSVALATLCLTPYAAFGQTSNNNQERQEFQDAYKKQRQNQAALFSAAPNHHITPKRDNISFALDTQIIDLAIAPDLDEIPEDLTELDHRLEMTGWSVFPLIAFSADRFGVGFTGEAGRRQVKYLSREQESDT
ncbi:MAG: hypothetical protein M3Q07_06770, partial [Pseudobdellovibrionaceae bacterium]|nr:hypothetical protein [Pseudobdellovibrionaceae bacterium]